jgi:hypothetical protein
MIKKTGTFRQRRAADTARWRERLHRSGHYERVVATRRRQARWRAQTSRAC